ncbi:MAG: hypothetical protein QOD69_2675 [Solirubrobacteraceae bacterium]|jgi:hypothetical protein|nr:hypothetical protein [Solirubrobacteraceae bacterium]
MRPTATSVAWVAAGQYGRITVTQLLEAGVDRDRIKRWVADGRLRREHVGVYALGHPDPSARGVYLSAALAAGPTAVVSHRAAAHLLRLVSGAPPPAEVTIPGGRRRRPGIRIHRSPLPVLDTSVLDGIPVTTVPRVLLDLVSATAPEQLTRMCHEAWVHHRAGAERVEACIARNPRKPGAAKLRRAQLADVTLSELEHRFVALLADHDLPKPRTNIDHAGDKVDCHWPALDLTIELHSYRYHATRHAFEQDLARRRRSDHIAYSYGDVFERPHQTAAELAAALGGHAGATG